MKNIRTAYAARRLRRSLMSFLLVLVFVWAFLPRPRLEAEEITAEVSSFDELAEVVNNAGENDVITVTLKASFNFGPNDLVLSGGKQLTLIGAGHQINFSNKEQPCGQILVTAGAGLVLGRPAAEGEEEGEGDVLTLTNPDKDPLKVSDKPMIQLNGGSLKMNKGVSLTNFITSADGVIVLLPDGDKKPSFEMAGGLISGIDRAEPTAEGQLDSYGSVIAVRSGQFSMSGGVIEQNNRTFVPDAAKQAVGAVYVAKDAGFNMTGGKMSQNGHEKCLGGALYLEEGAEAAISGGEISENEADNGAAVYSLGTLKLAAAEFKNNHAFNAGGAVYALNSVTADGTKFTANEAGTNGGAIFAASSLILQNNCEIKANKASNGAGLWLGSIAESSPAADIKKAKFTANEAVQSGGAIFFNDGRLSLHEAEISDNKAKLDGGGIYAGQTIEAEGLLIVKNNVQNTADPPLPDNIFLKEKAKIKLIGALAEGSRLYVHEENTSAAFSEDYSTYNTAPASSFFASDGKAQAVGLNDDGELYIVRGVTVIYAEDGALDNPEAVVLPEPRQILYDDDPEVSEAIPLPPLSAEGYQFLGWFLPGSTEPLAEGSKPNGHVTDEQVRLIAHWQKEGEATSSTSVPTEPTASGSTSPTSGEGTEPTATGEGTTPSETTPSPTPEPTATPTPSPTPEPTATPTPSPTPEPTATPTPSPTPEPTATPTPSPTPEPTATPTPSPTPTPEPTTTETTAAPTTTTLPPTTTAEPTPTPTPPETTPYDTIRITVSRQIYPMMTAGETSLAASEEVTAPAANLYETMPEQTSSAEESPETEENQILSRAQMIVPVLLKFLIGVVVAGLVAVIVLMIIMKRRRKY